MRRLRTYIAVFLLGVPAAVRLFAGDIHKEIRRSDEREARVRIESSFGTVNVHRGPSDKLAIIDYRDTKNKDATAEIDYRLRDNIGNLQIDLNPSGTSHSSDGSTHVNFDFKTDEWFVLLTDAVPIAFDASLGAGKADIDMTGLNLNKFALSTGASSTNIRFGSPNKSVIDRLKIEAGVSKLVAEGLNNANFRHMDFEGGVGSYYLNFDGDLRREVDVKIDFGMGQVTLVIPSKIGVKIRYNDSWLSSFSFANDIEKENDGLSVSSNYSNAEGRMNISIDSGVGHVKIRRTD
ncbi:MAG TPA: hypothetical protein VK470_06835 [Bacteroidota bacterium]|nr:hypothetical protein [Bacteroidota bacterium]